MVSSLEEMVTEQKRQRTVLVTAALPYINNVPHVGHIVGSHLPADIFARYCRLRGHKTLFVGGSDDHGTPAIIAAKQLGVPLEKFEDVIYAEHKQIYDWFNISYDNFSRTSRPVHHQTTIDFFHTLEKKGFISEGETESFYCDKDGRFLPDRYVSGECKHCGSKETFGDQCEKCGQSLDVKEVINPHCTLCGGTPVIKKSRHLFLRLDKISDKLDEWLDTKEGDWRPQVLNLAKGWIREGLRPRCITRDLEHGVRVPVKGYEDKVFYVWFDAPIGYVSSTKEAAPENWKDYWKNPDAEVYNFLGKDNIPFHTIFWPAMLLANGEFNLPKQVIGLQYLTFKGEKFSKSKNRGVFCNQLTDIGIPADVFRFCLTGLIPETNDTNFSWELFQKSINGDLIGKYGNLINRTVSFVSKNYGGVVKRPSENQIRPEDRQFFERVKARLGDIEKDYERVELRATLGDFLALCDEGNRYFDQSAPWKGIKEDRARTEAVLYHCLNLCKTLATVVSPILPDSYSKVCQQIGYSQENGSASQDRLAAVVNHSPEEFRVQSPTPLFSRLDNAGLAAVEAKTSVKRDLKTYFE
jgi:methionyl-tRNA synthetase